MAKIVNTEYSGKFNLPIPVGRLNANPIDSTEVWDTLSAAQLYAANGATAYVGQIIYVKETGKHYVIKNEAGTLEALAGSSKEYIRTGYYLNEKFYTDSTYTVEMPKEENVIYIDQNSRVTYSYDGEKYTRTNPIATDVVAGVMKLYNTTGDNEDGTMTQKAITEGMKNGVIDEDDEILVLTNITIDNMYVENHQ